MDAIILLGHGSRLPEASVNLEKVAACLRSTHSLVEACYMVRHEPLFPETLAKVCAAGATRVTVIPYFLHMGLHMQRDIPEILRAEAAKYPQVKVVLGNNLGYDDSLVDLVQKRIRESAQLPDIRDEGWPAAPLKTQPGAPGG